MKKLLPVLSIVLTGGLLTLLAPAALPCTAFFAYQDGLALVGNNEDFWDPDTKVWFVPAAEGTHGRVYFGFANLFPQGGMNEAGLFFDGFATESNPVTKFEGRKVFDGNLIDEAMARCATVAEVIALLEPHDLRFLENAMLMFADKTGDSVIVEGDEFLRLEGRHQVVTNFYQSKTTPDRYTCARHRIANRMLADSEGISVELFRRILAAVHVEETSQTLYSNVYDLGKGLVYVYHFHNYENVVVLDLAEELKKGAHVTDLPSLFPETFAHSRFVEKRRREIDEEKARRTASDIDPAVFAELVGTYELDITDEQKLPLRIQLKEGHLIVIGPEGDEAEILPASRDEWFYVGPDGRAGYLFHRDGEGKVTGLTVDYMGRAFAGTRVD